MAQFSGQLKPNEIFTTIYNMIISQQVFADNIAGVAGGLVDKARVDGPLYGDTKLYYSTDALKSYDWLHMSDVEKHNVLATHRPADPKCQPITLDVFRQIPLTVDHYLTKRAWADESAFSAFNSVMLGWMGDTKRIYDATTYNAFFGTTESAAAVKEVEIDLSEAEALSGEAKARVEAETIAQEVADLLVRLEDISRDFNDYGFLRSYDNAEIKVCWNSKWINKITKRDLPTIFHKDGLMDKFEEKLPSRYFGSVNSGVKVADAKTRSLIEQEINGKHYFAGDLITVGDSAPAGTSYQEDENVMAKVYVKLPPYMSSFSVGTVFVNPRALDENHYLTFGHNTLEYLENYPFITIKKKA